MLEQGPTEQSIIAQCVRQRRPLPNAIANAPELQLGLELFFGAFMDLTSERHVGFGEGPIPWRAVREWCNEHEVLGLQRDDVQYHVNKLDTVYLEHRARKHNTASKSDGGSKIIRPANPGNGPRRR